MNNILFYTYIEKTAQHKDSKREKAVKNLIAGGLSGALATAATIPLDIVATAAGAPAQKAADGTLLPRPSTKQIVVDLFNEGRTDKNNQIVKGVKGTLKGIGRFYKGLTPKVMKVVPMMGLTFLAQKAIYDKLNHKHD